MNGFSNTRILFSAHGFHPNLWLATKLLKDAGASVHFFSPGHSPHEDLSEIKPIVFGETPDKASVLEAYRSVRPDVVVLRWEGNERIADWLNQAARSDGVRRLEYSLDSLSYRPPFKVRVKDWARRKPTLMITPVREIGERLEQTERSVFLPLPVEQRETARRRPREPDAPLRVLLVGKLSQRRKGHLKALAWLDRLNGAFPVRLTIVGSDSFDVGGGSASYYQELLSAVETPRPAAAEVRLLRNLDHKAMPALYREQDLCLLPAYGERLGYAPLEAMAFGVAPVLTREVGCACYVEDGESGILLDVASPEQFDQRLTPLARDPRSVERLCDGAYRVYETYLRPELFASKFAAVLERL